MNKTPDLFKDIIPGSQPRQITIDANYDNPDSRYKFILHGEDIHIQRIIYKGEISIIRTFLPISKMTKYIYEENKNSIAESIHFEIKNENLNKDLAFHKIIDQDEDKYIVTIKDLKIENSESSETKVSS